eukprot:1192471-Prorocentrum_minimum.AAC.2
MPGGHQELLAGRHVVRARPQQIHHASRDAVLVRAEVIGEAAQHVCQERHRLHLRGLQVRMRGLQMRWDVRQGWPGNRDGFHHQRQQTRRVVLDVSRVKLEQEHHDQRALDHHLERASGCCQLIRLGGTGESAVRSNFGGVYGTRGLHTRLTEEVHHRGFEALINVAYEIQERLHLRLQSGPEVLVQIEDDAQTDVGVLLIVCLQYGHRQPDEIENILPQNLVVRQPVQNLQ